MADGTKLERALAAAADDIAAEGKRFALVGGLGVSVRAEVREAQSRLATIRLRSPQGVKVDLLFASSGIEAETIARATIVALPSVGAVPIARAEELLSLKVLSMTDGDGPGATLGSP